MSVLRLWKGYNNGVFTAVVNEIDPDGAVSAFDLTSGTITVEIYERSGLVKTSFTGTATDATNGIYSAAPDADDLNTLTPGSKYYWRTKVVNATYPQGRLFAEDADGRLQSVIVEGSSAGT